MRHARFHHGCVLTTYEDNIGVMVMGGLGPDNDGDSVEFLQLSSDTLSHQWTLLASLSQPHPNQPIAAHLAGHTVLIGGGGYPYPGGENIAEMLTTLFLIYRSGNIEEPFSDFSIFWLGGWSFLLEMMPLGRPMTKK